MATRKTISSRADVKMIIYTFISTPSEFCHLPFLMFLKKFSKTSAVCPKLGKQVPKNQADRTPLQSNSQSKLEPIQSLFF